MFGYVSQDNRVIHRMKGRPDVVVAMCTNRTIANFIATALAPIERPDATAALITAVRQWANDRNLIEGSTSQAQMVKLTEEVGEIAAAVARSKRDDLKDGIGDAVVVLTILAAQNDLTLEECVAAAYGEIKDRKGRMVNGVFVREQ